MIEKEFKDLINNLEMQGLEKKNTNTFINFIFDTLKNNCSKAMKLIDISLEPNTNNIIKNTKTFNIFCVYELKNKTLPYELYQEAVCNEIINTILLNVKNNIIFKEKLPIITKDLKNNLLRIGLSDYEIAFNLIFKRDCLFKNEPLLENKSFYYENYLIRNEYFELMNKTYPRFNQTLMIINKFSKDLNMNDNHYIYSLLLGYGISTYETENSYLGYLKSFVHALTDLLEEKSIILNENIYKSLKVLGKVIGEGKYKLIDVSNKQNNLLCEYESLRSFKELKTYLISRFPKDGANVKIDCTPKFVLTDKTIEWSFKICNTEIANNGGEYEYNEDNVYSCIYKAILKGLQFISKNKLGNNIDIVVGTIGNVSLDNVFPNQLIKDEMNKISYENQSRYANVLAYAKDNDLGLQFNIKK